MKLNNLHTFKDFLIMNKTASFHQAGLFSI